MDVLIDLGSTRIPVEIKSGETLHADRFKGLDYYAALADIEGGALVHGGLDSPDRSAQLVRSFVDVS